VKWLKLMFAPNESGTISYYAGTMSFGTITVGSTPSQAGTLIASGSKVTVSSVTSTSNDFSVGGLTLPITKMAILQQLRRNRSFRIADQPSIVET
jgi:hypothetical protein